MYTISHKLNITIVLELCMVLFGSCSIGKNTESMCIHGNFTRCCSNYFPVGNDCEACPSGTFGVNCSKLCPAGTYGRLCLQDCKCTGNQICNPVSGCQHPSNGSPKETHNEMKTQDPTMGITDDASINNIKSSTGTYKSEQTQDIVTIKFLSVVIAAVSGAQLLILMYSVCVKKRPYCCVTVVRQKKVEELQTHL